MIQPVAFATDVNFLVQNGQCICSRSCTHTQVVIRLQLKELIERGDWSYLRSEEAEEIRSLRELGFLIDLPP